MDCNPLLPLSIYIVWAHAFLFCFINCNQLLLSSSTLCTSYSKSGHLQVSRIMPTSPYHSHRRGREAHGPAGASEVHRQEHLSCSSSSAPWVPSWCRERGVGSISLTVAWTPLLVIGHHWGGFVQAGQAVRRPGADGGEDEECEGQHSHLCLKSSARRITCWPLAVCVCSVMSDSLWPFGL